MMTILDVSLQRERAIQMNDLKNVDINYSFFYDETNNPKKFKITNEGFNVNENDFFILGGIVHRSENHISNEKVEQLFAQLITQKNKTEIYMLNGLNGL